MAVYWLVDNRVGHRQEVEIQQSGRWSLLDSNSSTVSLPSIRGAAQMAANVIIYAHGLSETSEGAMQKIRERRDLHSTLIIIVKWNSGKKTDYLTARDKLIDRANGAREMLAQFLTEAGLSSFARIHLVCHSMGSRVCSDSTLGHLTSLLMIHAEIKHSEFRSLNSSSKVERVPNKLNFFNKSDRALALSTVLNVSNRMGQKKIDGFHNKNTDKWFAHHPSVDETGVAFQILAEEVAKMSTMPLLDPRLQGIQYV